MNWWDLRLLVAQLRYTGNTEVTPKCPYSRQTVQYTWSMDGQIAPQLFTTDIPSTLAYYKAKLGLESVGTLARSPREYVPC
jgi:hypothetical protein